MADMKTGGEVFAQAHDSSLWNTEPVVAKAAVVGVVTSVCLALGAFGVVSEEQRLTIIEQVGNITYGVFVVLPIIITLLTAVWQRVSAFSPRTAARSAVASAQSGVATLDPPP